MMPVALRPPKSREQSGRLGVASAYTGSGHYSIGSTCHDIEPGVDPKPGVRPATVIPGWWPAGVRQRTLSNELTACTFEMGTCTGCR